MANDTLNTSDLQVASELETLSAKISGHQYSSEELDAKIAYAVGLYLRLLSQQGNSPADLQAKQDSIQSDLEGFLGSDNAAAIATDLDLLLKRNAQHSPDPPSQTSGVVGEPVHLGTGQFIQTVTDFVVAGAGIDFVFSRTYKSSAFYFGPMGANWDHAFNLWLRDNGDSVTVTTGRLLPIRYLLHQFFPYYVAIGDDNVVVKTLDGAFEQCSPDGRIVRFEQQVGDADGTIYRVVQISDRFGNFLEFSYDNQNRLSTVKVNHPKRIVAFTYDDQSRIQNITLFRVTYTTESGPAPVERVWTYTYDDFFDLVAVTGPATDEFPAGRTTQYAYSSPSSFVQRQHDLLNITDPNGITFLENEFGNAPGTVAYGKVVRQRVGSGVFLFDYSQVIPDSSWSFSDADQPTSCVTVVQRDGHPVRYVLNAMGNILASEETIVGAGEQTIVWRYAYDADGRRTATVSPGGRVTQIYYGREDFYRRKILPGNPLVPMWQDPYLSAVEHARFANIIASVKRSAKLTLTGLLDDLAIYGDVFPGVLDVDALNDIIIKRSYENTFQQLATSSDPRYTASPDPAATESSAYSKHLTVTTFRTVSGITDAAPAAIIYPDTTFPAPLPSGATGVAGAQMTFDSYDSNGRLLQWTEPEGNVFAYGYFGPSASPTTEGFLASSTAGVGALDLRTIFAVNEAGQVIGITDPLGNTTQYAIDACSLVRRVTPPIAGYEIGCSYDGNAQVVSRTTAIIDPDGSVAPGSPEVVTFEYNEEMSVVLATIGDKSTTPPRKTRRVYDPSNRLIRLVKPRGNSVCYEYDERSLLKRATSACCEPEAATTAFSHDLDEIVVRVTNPRGFVATTTLDAFARPIRITDPLGNIQRIDYDKLNNPVVRRWFGALINGNYPLLRRAEYVYDERGHLIRERKAFFTLPIPTADPWGHPDAEFNAAVQSGQVQWNDTLTFYDANERIFRIVDPNGHATTMEYDAADRLVATTDPTGNVTRSTYDAGSNIVRVDRYLVDASGNTQAVLSTVYEFDPLNRLRATTDGAGNRITRKFDSRGLLRTVTDALGHVRKYGYNGFRDRVTAIEVLLPTSAGGTTTELTTTTSFDPNSNVVGITDPNGNVTRFEYDPLDRPRLVVNPDGTSRTMRYDPCSNLTDTVDEETLHVTRTYDGLDRLTGIAVQQPQGPASAEQSAQFAYDGVGMLIGHANSFLNVTRSCDSLGRCYQETLTYGPPLDVFTSPLTLLRQFDASSNRIGLGYPSGQTLRYDFGSDNRFMQLRSIANAVAYPGDPGAPANRSILQKQRWGDLTISSQFGNGVTIASAYDAAGRRIADACSLPTGQNFTLQQLWDGAGNRALTIEIQAGTPIGWWHAYDSTNRLIDSASLSNAQAVVTGPLAPPNAPLVVTAFRCQQAIDAIVSGYGMSLPAQPGLDYDAAGNRARQETSGGTTLYSANVRNEYVTVGGAPLTYDRAGRLISDTQFTFAYNFRGQLVEAVSQSSGIQIFHDANGTPVGIVEGALKRVLVVDGASPIETYDNGVLSAVYFWEGQDRLNFFATAGKDEYVFRDVLSSTRLTSGSQGAMTGTFQYDAFGNLISGSPSAPFLFCGKYLYNTPAGWYEYRTRQYIPSLGRFAQPDPGGFVDGTNLYTFVSNNPLSANDPTGMDRQNVARGATSQSDQTGYVTYRIDDVYRKTSQIVRFPIPSGSSYSDFTVGGWMSGMPYGRMLTMIDWGGELSPPPLVDAEDPLSPPPLVDAPNYQRTEIMFSDADVSDAGDEITVPRVQDDFMLRHELSQINNNYIPTLEKEMEKTRQKAKSSTIAAVPFVGNYIAAAYDIFSGNYLGSAENLAEKGLKESTEGLIHHLGKIEPFPGWDAPLDIYHLDKDYREHNENVIKWQDLKFRRYIIMRKLGLPDAWLDNPGGHGYSYGPDGRLYRYGKPAW